MNFLNSSRNRFLATAVSAIFLLAASFYFITWGIFNGIRQSSAAISAARSSLNFFDKRKEAARANEDNLQKLKNDLERIKKSFFEKDNPLDFIETLEKTAKISSVLSEITPVEGESDSSRTFLISAAGNYPNLFKFLKLIEIMPYKVSIEKANFRKQLAGGAPLKLGETARAGDLRLDLTIKVEIR
jgi:hypothetical protein